MTWGSLLDYRVLEYLNRKGSDDVRLILGLRVLGSAKGSIRVLYRVPRRAS